MSFFSKNHDYSSILIVLYRENLIDVSLGLVYAISVYRLQLDNVNYT